MGPRVGEGAGHGGAGDGKSAGDLAGDQVGVGGQALVSLVIRQALIGAGKGVECGEEFGTLGVHTATTFVMATEIGTSRASDERLMFTVSA